MWEEKKKPAHDPMLKNVLCSQKTAGSARNHNSEAGLAQPVNEVLEAVNIVVDISSAVLPQKSSIAIMKRHSEDCLKEQLPDNLSQVMLPFHNVECKMAQW